ncbi:high-affinity branched-chain amino acid transport ATP-binding proteinlivG [Afipia carboxidovorans OM5]|uniref:ABC transporter, branched-chain amino acid transport ATP-binding protein LivG n=1 Tax=Afipia carboxidovorans (strain ATCC 49405 / DSM 1227 / KCTC 32145 / OM5) TaxID=504832 RepID=B6JJK5_AFIC5|nr:ABC transporter ATP-binding protein [Afipia carboxidovorans]ACI94599.1 high-affinity branched-chain amino acid transport ATP-binding proteinlivG [Afipia carboxidovorans OM5]AEI01788.1 ABC transporter, branched-chain amino acid transport ATP-binding protein LivG [Afipia carboxidovorans OM4]AEI05363.1 ABC transporter, branched-chain amino acid transport ATP-binding protein LivG [Afipia carboxidovorans OM5]
MTHLFSAKDVSVKFGGLQALDSLSLDINEGTITGLIGPNGSGKTTFFNAVTGLCNLSGGQVSIDGKEIGGLPARQIYQFGVTRTFQRSRLCLSLSVFDNIVIGRQNSLDLGIFSNLIRRRQFNQSVRENYERVHGLLRAFSEPLAQRIFDPLHRLNMIDRRRIEVCRALIAEPRLLLLDEPSAGMTPDETREFMGDILNVRKHNPRMSIIIIEHEMDIMQRVAEHCVVLNYGRKVAEGTFEAVVADPWVQEAYLGTS